MRFRDLRPDVGDADPISTILGTAMFVAASAAAAALLVLILSAGAQAQARTEVTLAVQVELDTFSTQPLAAVIPEAARTVDLPVGTRMVRVWRSVTAAGDGAMRLTIAAPRKTGAQCGPALTTPTPGCLALSVTRAPSVLEQVPASVKGFTARATPSGSALIVADLDRSLLAQSDALDLRVALQTRPGAPVGAWRIAVTCDPANPLPVTADSTPVPAQTGGQWLTTRVTLPSPASLALCPTPQLRLWSTTGATPAPADVLDARAWRTA